MSRRIALNKSTVSDERFSARTTPYLFRGLTEANGERRKLKCGRKFLSLTLTGSPKLVFAVFSPVKTSGTAERASSAAHFI
jgi:hypothetical protein